MSELLVTFDRTAGGLVGQLTNALREAIRSGRLAPGAPLPSSRELAADLRVSRGVVVESYEQLAAEGFLSARRGAGTRVAATAGVSADGPPDPGARSATGASSRPDGYDLRAGQPDLAAFPRAAWLAATRRVLARLPNEALGYGDAAGHPEVRGELADHLRRVRAAQVEPADLVIVGGVAQGIALTLRVLRSLGHRRLAVEDPSSAAHRDLLAAAGLELVGVPVDNEGLDVAALQASGATAVVTTPAHQFPVAVVLSPARRGQLVAWARHGDHVIIEDDYDAEFRYDREPVGCVQGLAPDRVVHLGSVSKSLAPGLRLGWAVAPPDLAAGLAQAKRDDDLGCPVIDQLVLAELIATGGYDRHLRTVRRRYRARRDALVNALAHRLPAASVRGVAAGLHLYVELPPGSDEDAVVAAAEAAGVHVLGVGAMRFAPGAPAIVLGYAHLSEQRLVAAAAHLADACARTAR
jgi:GntR family transcriptional regulator/MocR family aminotransferase